MEITFGQGWEQGLGNFYKEYYKATLNGLGFELSEKLEGPGMGALIIFVGHGMLVRIINDRDQYFVSIGSEMVKGQWWDIGFIMSYFKIIDDNISRIDKIKREKILWFTYNWENYADNAKYFSTHFDRIRQLFHHDIAEDSTKNLKKLMDELRKYRQKKMNNPEAEPRGIKKKLS